MRCRRRGRGCCRRTAAIENAPAYLATVVGRVSLNMLRSRQDALGGADARSGRHPGTGAGVGGDPGRRGRLGDDVVLETLTAAERLSFVLHDLFAVPSDEIAPLIGRTPAAVRQLASRGRGNWPAAA